MIRAVGPGFLRVFIYFVIIREDRINFLFTFTVTIPFHSGLGRSTGSSRPRRCCRFLVWRKYWYLLHFYLVHALKYIDRYIDTLHLTADERIPA